MAERTNTPPTQPPSEQEVQEFFEKFQEFFEDLPEREKLQAASLATHAAAEDGDEQAQQIGVNREAEPLSEEEIQEFMGKLHSFHDSLPEGEHQILDAMIAKAGVQMIPEDERDDVQGNIWLWSRWVAYGDNRYRDYLANYCYNQGGRLYWTGGSYNTSTQWSCWR